MTVDPQLQMQPKEERNNKENVMNPIMKKQLPVKLTTTEREAKAQEFAALWAEYDETEALKSRTTKQLSDKMKTLREKATEARQVYTTGIEDRSVDCHEIANITARTWELWRLDTHELVSSRPMSATEIEKQAQLDWTKRVEAAQDGDAA